MLLDLGTRVRQRGTFGQLFIANECTLLSLVDDEREEDIFKFHRDLEFPLSELSFENSIKSD